MLSRASQEDNSVFIELARNDAELTKLTDELTDRRSQLAESEDALSAATERLREQFASVQDEYEELKAELARLAALRARRAEARREAAAEAAAAPAPAPQPASAPAPAPQPVVHATGGMACPVAGPNSFVDSWGAPRSGHTHQGVDIMADYGTPVVAIVSGTITYAAYNGSGGNMIFLSGDNGNQYWYMHNQQNLVTSGHVSVGQQIATVGDTGNATGIPHLHFEYHPGGGGAVNPYPLVASIC
jgi:peptidoglycan LD-endopeptidase LytH